MTIEECRDDAIKILGLYRSRYKGQDDKFVPLNIAIRWARAFERDDVDMDEIAGIMREAEKEKDRYDIAFFTFCNHMRKIYQNLWQDFLSRGETIEP